MQDKLKVWTSISKEIQSLLSSNIILGDDFNVILDHSKNFGGIYPPIKTIQDFSYFVDNNNRMDVIPSQGYFTWTNKRAGFAQIVVHFDRFLITQE